MWTRFQGGFEKMYGGRECDGHADYGMGIHVFDEKGYPVCECGRKKTVACRCADCEMRHTKLVITTADEQLQHELMRLHFKLARLEQPTAIATESTGMDAVQ